MFILHLFFMNQNLLEAFKNHLSHKSYLSPSQVEEILLMAPEALYSGVLYRVIETPAVSKEIQDLSQDSSFSKSQKGIKYFLNTHDFKNIQVYKAQGTGIDLLALVPLLKKYKIKVPEYVFQEEEVISFKIHSFELIFSGSPLDFS